MKTQVLSALGFAATAAVAAPGFFDNNQGCDEIIYEPAKCPNCPYKPNYNLKRGGDYESYGGDSCHQECPKEHRVCKDYKPEYKHQEFELSFQEEEISCSRDFRYQLDVKIEECSSEYRGQECLNVNYLNGQGYNKRGGDYSSISESNLGIYLQEESFYNPKEFNYNNYCQEDHCSVPTEYLPGSEDLCDREIYLAVGNNECYDNYSFDDEEYKQSTRYVKVKVSCNQEYDDEEACNDYCCCP